MIRVLVHGCFDVLHVGHVRLLKFAKSLGDVLIVSIASDRHVTDSKGEARPVNRQDLRKEMVESFDFVDHVIIMDGLGYAATMELIRKVRPDVYVKGQEYQGRLVEYGVVEECGGRVVFMDEFEKAECSTTTILERASA